MVSTGTQTPITSYLISTLQVFFMLKIYSFDIMCVLEVYRFLLQHQASEDSGFPVIFQVSKRRKARQETKYFHELFLDFILSSVFKFSFQEIFRFRFQLSHKHTTLTLYIPIAWYCFRSLYRQVPCCSAEEESKFYFQKNLCRGLSSSCYIFFEYNLLV